MSLFQPINCQQSLEQYCIYSNGGKYQSITDCIQNRPCEPTTFSKCGTDLNEFTYRRKKVYAKYLGIPISEIDNYWEYSPEEDLTAYNLWNETCEYNASSLHSLSLNIVSGLNYDSFQKELELQSGGFTEYFSGKYPEDFYQTYVTQRVPVETYNSFEENYNEGLTDNKIFLVVGAVILGIMFFKKK